MPVPGTAHTGQDKLTAGKTQKDFLEGLKCPSQMADVLSCPCHFCRWERLWFFWGNKRWCSPGPEGSQQHPPYPCRAGRDADPALHVLRPWVGPIPGAWCFCSPRSGEGTKDLLAQDAVC